MKHSFTCPKCRGTRVIKIKGNRMNQNQVISLTKWATATAVLDRYLCTKCGYTEEWLQLDDKFRRWLTKNKDLGNLESDFV